MSDLSNGEEEASAQHQLPLAQLLRDGPPPSKRNRPNDDSENESEADRSSTSTDRDEAQENPIDQDAAQPRAEPAMQDENEPAVQNTILNLRQQLLNLLLDEEHLFGKKHKLSYEVGSPGRSIPATCSRRNQLR